MFVELKHYHEDYIYAMIKQHGFEEVNTGIMQRMVILSGKMINKESLIYIVLNLQMRELFIEGRYISIKKLFPVLEERDWRYSYFLC